MTPQTIATRWLVAVACFVGGWLSSPTGALRADEPLAVPELITRLQDWRANVTSLRVRWKTSNVEGSRQDHPGRTDAELAGNYYFYDFTWTDSGSYRLEVVAHEWGELKHRLVEGAEGKANARRVRLSIPCPPLYGLWDAGHGLWLDEQLLQSPLPLAWTDGRRLRIPTANSDTARLITFNPARGWLPDAVEPIPGPDTDADAFRWRCDTWREIAPGRWFPQKGKLGPLTSDPPSDWEVQSVELNPELPADFFRNPKSVKGMRF